MNQITSKYGFQIDIELKPIIKIKKEHVAAVCVKDLEEEKFCSWSEEKCKNFARLQKKILSIYREQDVFNVLTIAQQKENQTLTVSFVPYPECNWKEKIQGLFYFIFGAPPLENSKIQSLKDFYQVKFSTGLVEDSPQEIIDTNHSDFFCKPDVINRQKILAKTYADNHYQLLQDIRPKLLSQEDLHLLVVPEKEAHLDSVDISVKQRQYLWYFAKEVTRVFQQQIGEKNWLYIERHGKKLASVQHQHLNLHCFKEMPKTLFGKVHALVRLFFLRKLSPLHLENKINEHRTILSSLESDHQPLLKK